MPLDPLSLPTDPDPARAFGPVADWRPPQADAGLCRESRRGWHPLAGGSARLGQPSPAAPEPDAASPASGLTLEDIEARLAHAPRDDISGLRGMVHLYQRLVDMLLTQPDPPAATSRRQWRRLRQLQRRLRSAARRPAPR